MPNDKTHPITIRVSTEMLNEIVRRIPCHRLACRERFVLDAVAAYLGHPEKVFYKKPAKPSHVTKVVSESTDTLKTGRYEP